MIVECDDAGLVHGIVDELCAAIARAAA